MSKTLTFVTGYFGAPIEERARRIADANGLAFLSLDREIERRDGRKINRLCMMNGEHGYRNQEYEILNEINEDPDGFCAANGLDTATEGMVIACGDGVLYDDMSCEIVMAGELVIAGADMTRDALWESAKADTGTYHAFMFFGSEEEKRAAFEDYLDRQTALFAKAQE